MLGIFERLIRDLFFAVGWPTWADSGRLEPGQGEALPPR